MITSSFMDLQLQAAGLRRTDHSVRERVEIIEGTSWSNEFHRVEIEILAKYMTAHKAPKGTVICREGADEAFMCLIVEGKVSVLKDNSGLDKKLITSLGPGKTFGEMAFIDDEPRSASVVASEETTVLVLTKENFLQLTDEMPRLVVKMLIKIAKLISQRLRHTTGSLVDHLRL